jgi:hypothetical protein
VAKLQKVWSTRINGVRNTYIGEKGRLFYDEATGVLRLSDGVTPGGQPIGIEAVNIITDTLVPGTDNIYGIGTGALRWNHIHLGDGGIYFDGSDYPDPQTVPYLPSSLVNNLVPAYTNGNLSIGNSSHRWGDIWIGRASLHMQDETTGADVAFTVNNGTLYLNGAQNLAVGNLVIVDTTLTSATNNLDISIGAIDDTGFFYIKRKAQFDNTTYSPTEPMVSMNASGGADPVTILPDTVMQTVGRPNKNSRVIQRAYGATDSIGGNNSYAVWGSYAARGTVAAPAAIKQNDILSRLSSNGFGATTWGTGGTRIESVAVENFTDSAKGSKINFWTTPIGSNVSQQVASITTTGISANAITFVTDDTTQTTAGIPLTQKGNSLGVATLDSNGYLTAAQIPPSLIGGVLYKGAWDASTNTPELANGSGTAGWEYSISVAGTQNLGAGSQAYAQGGFVIYNGSVWSYVPPFGLFTSLTAGTHLSVNQPTGAITISTDATSAYTAGAIVSRDASGNFSANVITAALSGQATSAVTAATVTASAQTNITSVGTLTSLAVTGNVTTGNVSGTKGTFTTIAGTLLGIETDTYISALRANITAANTAINSLSTGANANTAAYLTTATINTTGNITAGNVIATAHYGNVVGKATQLATAGTTAIGTFLAGKLSAATGSVPKNSVATVTYTITGLTTSHKIIISSGTVTPDRQFSITAAWASALNTVSIEYANNSGGAVSVTLDINYFAFV